MIFPQHRVVAQLIKDADMTPEEALIAARRMVGIQGTLAPEDYNLLGHDLAWGGLRVAAVPAQFSAVGWGLTDTTAQMIATIETIQCDALANMFLITPTDTFAGYAATNARFRDDNITDLKRSTPLLAPRMVNLSQTLAAPVGQLVGPIIPNSQVRIDHVVREGYGLVLWCTVANQTFSAFATWREKQLRIR